MGEREADPAVAITGLGAVSPLAAGFASHYSLLLAGRSGVAGAAAPAAAGGPWVRDRVLRKCLPPAAAMAVAAAAEALRDAGLADDTACLGGAGLYLGSPDYHTPVRSYGAAVETSLDETGAFDLARFAARGVYQLDPMLVLKGLPNAGACGVAAELGVLGPTLNVAGGWVGGMQAVAAAADAVAAGEVEVAVCGGYDSLLMPGALPAGAVTGEGGFVPGEGAAVCVLETAHHARRRGARVYALLVAAGDASGEAALERAARRACGAAPGRVPDTVFG